MAARRPTSPAPATSSGPAPAPTSPSAPVTPWGTQATTARFGTPVQWAAWALACSLATGLFLGIHPASLTFWDTGRSRSWKALYAPNERPQQFEKIADLIPPTARVASTDFVHPRYTHFERSYDYSDYPRKVANYEDKVPDDTDFIVIDTTHPYSKVRSVDQVRELKQQPPQWDLLPDTTNGAFLVLKRREPSGN